MSIQNSWDEVLKDEFCAEYYKKLQDFLKNERKTQTVFPKEQDTFNALSLTAYEDVKVVILGQDPYHGAGQSHGLCFSVQKGTKNPPSLVNIFKEIKSDVGVQCENGTLESWAKQGVLLLNAVLSVREAEPNSHKGQGWERLTDKIIETLNCRHEPIVFMLWGANARSKKKFITSAHHLILETTHPSPLSAYAGFLGCKHFSKANDFLKKNGQTPIDWQT